MHSFIHEALEYDKIEENAIYQLIKFMYSNLVIYKKKPRLNSCIKI